MNEQLKAADALLDIGISIPLRAVRFRKWRWTPRVTIKRPPLGGLLRILRVWLVLEIDVKQLDNMSDNDKLELIAKHGRALSKMVALMVCSGVISGKVLAPALSLFLRWRCHPDVLLYTSLQFLQLQDTQSFIDIIRSVEAVNLLQPRVSQRKRS